MNLKCQISTTGDYCWVLWPVCNRSSEVQPINFIQVISTSEFHEYWWKDLGFFHNPPYWLCLGLKSLKKWHVQKLSMIPEKPQYLSRNLLDICDIPWTFNRHLTDIQQTFDGYSMNNQGTFNKHLIDIRWTIKGNLTDNRHPLDGY